MSVLRPIHSGEFSLLFALMPDVSSSTSGRYTYYNIKSDFPTMFAVFFNKIKVNFAKIGSEAFSVPLVLHWLVFALRSIRDHLCRVLVEGRLTLGAAEIIGLALVDFVVVSLVCRGDFSARYGTD